MSPKFVSSCYRSGSSEGTSHRIPLALWFKAFVQNPSASRGELNFLARRLVFPPWIGVCPNEINDLCHFELAQQKNESLNVWSTCHPVETYKTARNSRPDEGLIATMRPYYIHSLMSERGTLRGGVGRLTRIFSWSCNLGQCLPKIFLEFERKTGNSKEMKGISVYNVFSCIFYSWMIPQN